MDAYTLLSDFRSRGIKLVPNGEKLTVEPASRLTDADRAAIRAAKTELLKLLAAVGIQDRRQDEIDPIARPDGWSPPPTIPAAIALEIKGIESQALALGWPRERLWSFAFWPHRGGEPRGLASVMDPGDDVIEVTADFMLIEKSNSRGERLRFWRTDG
ncbi:hypothetical protein [Candidatus Binatus sp.]|uniref:TubC N-terminal docking domain-related protein n=1 Tax=Candidatus Binatus sp. TaxID=2811406 RepID=UPI003BB10EB2